MPNRIPISSGIYRFPQRAYPAEFREIYGDVGDVRSGKSLGACVFNEALILSC